jgi:hypothetical protein
MISEVHRVRFQSDHLSLACVPRFYTRCHASLWAFTTAG